MSRPEHRGVLWVGVVALLVLVSAGCGGGSSLGKDLGSELGDGDALPDGEDGVQGDVPLLDGETEVPDIRYDKEEDPRLDIDRVEPDVQIPTCLGPGQFMCECEKDSDCLSGYCVSTPNGKVCSMFCMEDCPDGWECMQDITALPDAVFVCLPQDIYVCRPCNADVDCRSPYVASNDLCVAHGQNGGFCGRDCAGHGRCPGGYICAEVTTAAGAVAYQCSPEGGLCSCSKLSILDGAWTSCSRTSGYGTCIGKRVCRPEGLTECDAKIPKEEACNGEDDNCDGIIDPPNSPGCITWYVDNDGDGYGLGIGDCLCGDKPSPKHTTLGGDCNDSNVSVHPGAVEVCNRMDDNCDGGMDPPGSVGCQTMYVDGDGDGIGDSTKPACLCWETAGYALVGGDCDDTDNTVGPGGPELCDGQDNNCNGLVDEENAIGCMPYYLDQDGDTYGLSSQVKCLCAPMPSWGYTASRGGDCDDFNPQVHPTAAEICDGVDNNCNGETDEGNAVASCGVVPNGTVGCGSTGCTVASCNPGWHDLNLAFMDGCECQVEASDVPNQTCSSATNMGEFADNGSSTTVTARIVPANDVDWYKFTGVDGPDLLGCDTFHVRVRFLKNPNNAYWFRVFKGGCAASANVCSETTTFSFRVDFNETNKPEGSVGFGECPCKPDAKTGAGQTTPTNYTDDTQPGVHQCTSQTETYYVEVSRKPGAPLICDEYQLEISNGAGM